MLMSWACAGTIIARTAMIRTDELMKTLRGPAEALT
jgi:hypothetical protein